MTEPRTVVYRGASRSEVERKYHAGARTAVDEGYAPASEEWSNALGQEVLTVRYAYDPDQASAVLSALDAAERESRTAAMAPRITQPPAATPAVAVQQPDAKPPRSTTLRTVIVVLIIVLGAVAAWQSGLFGGGSVLPPTGGAPANVPPTGQMWFGTSFDPNTFSISGRTSTARTGSTVAAVANLPRSISSGDANMRVSLDGEVIALQQITMQGSGDLFGISLGPYFLAGLYKYEILDLGGNVLASGSLTVTG
jgi:hypothetical protein